MNERIQELAVKAKLMAEEDINRQISYNAELKAFAEKFAELIVKELVNICTPDIIGRLDGRPYETADDFDRGFIDGQDCCVELIKKHFEVEE